MHVGRFSLSLRGQLNGESFREFYKQLILGLQIKIIFSRFLKFSCATLHFKNYLLVYKPRQW